MEHNDIDTVNGDQGHWAVAPSSNGVDMLVQIGEIGERRQARPRMPVPVALHLAADLLAAAARPAQPGTMHVGDYDGPWLIVCREGMVTLTLRDPACNANAEATVAMPPAIMRDMGIGIIRCAVELLRL